MGKGKQDTKLLQQKTRNRKLRDENKKLVIENDRLKSLLANAEIEANKIISEYKQRIMILEANNSLLKSQYADVQKKIKIDEDKQSQKRKSRNIVGWTVMKDSDGYYRAKKTFKGKTKTVYIGKKVIKTTKAKLQKKEKEIRLNP